MMLWAWLSEPFMHAFMQHALIAAVAVSAVCALLSCFVVLKGWSLMGDAVSHAVFPGVVLSAWLGAPIALGAFIAGMMCALSVGFLKQTTRIKEDTLMGVVFAGMFALGVVLFAKIDTDQHLRHILFGNLLGIGIVRLTQTVAVAVAVFILLLLKRRDLLLYCFDESHARVSGLSPTALRYGLLAALSLTIVVAMQAVGVILVIAMLISPGITAFLLTKRFGAMLCVAIVCACMTSVAGVVISYHLDSATGATIVLTQAVLFIVALAIHQFKNRLTT